MSDLDRLRGPDSRVGLGWIPIASGLVLAVAMLVTWPSPTEVQGTSDLGLVDAIDRAHVIRVLDGACTYAPDTRCRTVVFMLDDGPRAGTQAVQEFSLTPTTPEFTDGERVVLARVPDAETGVSYQFSDRERRPLLVAVFIAFAVAVAALGRGRGVAALLGLVLSVVVLVAYVVPAIVGGAGAVQVSLIGAGAVALLALYLAHGFRPLTHVAFVGTASALVITFLLAAWVVAVARFSGFASEESLFLTAAGGIDVRGLLLAGVVLGTLGALDDVTVTQASAVWELQRANPSLPVGALAQSALRIGRDHIASTVNTLLLAYAGASLPLLLLFSVSGLSVGVVANSEVVAVEIVRTLVGSIGLVLSVPLTTYLAAAIAVRTRIDV